LGGFLRGDVPLFPEMEIGGKNVAKAQGESDDLDMRAEREEYLRLYRREMARRQRQDEALRLYLVFVIPSVVAMTFIGGPYFGALTFVSFVYNYMKELVESYHFRRFLNWMYPAQAQSEGAVENGTYSDIAKIALMVSFVFGVSMGFGVMISLIVSIAVVVYALVSRVAQEYGVSRKTVVILFAPLRVQWAILALKGFKVGSCASEKVYSGITRAHLFESSLLPEWGRARTLVSTVKAKVRPSIAMEHRWKAGMKAFYVLMVIVGASATINAAVPASQGRLGAVRTKLFGGQAGTVAEAQSIVYASDSFTTTSGMWADAPTRVHRLGEKLVQTLDIPPTAAPLRGSLLDPSKVMSSDAVEKLRTNIAFVRMFDDKGNILDGSHALRYRTGLVAPAHVFHKMADGTRVTVYNSFSGLSENWLLSRSDMVIDEQKDVASLPNSVSLGVRCLGRTLRFGRFAVGDQVEMLGRTKEGDVRGTIIAVEPRSYAKARRECMRETEVYVCRFDNYVSKAGDCFRPIVKKVEGGYILGSLHIAVGHTGEGLSLPVDEGFFPTPLPTDVAVAQSLSEIALRPEFDFLRQPPRRGLYAYRSVAPGEVLGDVIGVVSKPTGISTSNLRESPFKREAAMWLAEMGKAFMPAPMKTEPRYDTELAANVEVSPFAYGMSAHDAIGYISPEEVRLVEEGLFITLTEGVPFGSHGSIADVDGALRKGDHVVNVNPNTSSGMMNGGCKGKYMIGDPGIVMEDGGIAVYAAPEVRRMVRSLIDFRASGEVVATQAKAFLKDELISQSKHEAMRTRIVNAERMPEYILERMIYKEALGLMLAKLAPLGSCLGINAAGPEWAVLFEGLVEPEDGVDVFCYDVDFSKFDKCLEYVLHRAVMVALTRAACHYYGYEEGSPEWRLVMSDVDASIYVLLSVDDSVVEAYVRNLTGRFMTTTVNTVYHLVLLFLIFRRMDGGKLKWPEFCSLRRKRQALYGDDGVVCMPPSQMKRFPMDKFSEIALQLGAVATNGSDKGAIAPVPPHALRFLKRGFRKADGRVYAPLEESSIYKSLLAFEPKGDEELDEARHRSVLRTAWEEAWMHDPVTQKRIRSRILELCPRVGAKISKFTPDSELAARWDSGGMVLWELPDVDFKMRL
jgi:hypothetical protein